MAEFDGWGMRHELTVLFVSGIIVWFLVSSWSNNPLRNCNVAEARRLPSGASQDNGKKWVRLTTLKYDVEMQPAFSLASSYSSCPDRYTALQLGVSNAKAKNITKPLLQHFANAGVHPKRKLGEFRVNPDAILPLGECCVISLSTWAAQHFQTSCVSSSSVF